MKQAATLLLFVVSAVSLVVAGGKPLSPPQFIPVEVPGATETEVFGINNAGVMVGAYFVGELQHGFASFGGKVMKIDVGPPAYTTCTGINISNTVSGYYINPPGKNPAARGFLYQNGTFVDVGPPGEAYAYGLNDTGEVVGWYSSDFGNTFHGFLFDGTAYHDVDVPGAVPNSSMVMAINNQGLVVVQYVLSSQNGAHNHAALYDGSTYTNIDVPGAADTFPRGINDAGDGSFTWEYAGGTPHGALLHAGHYYNFMVPGSNWTDVFGINDNDIVVGMYYDHSLKTIPGYKLIP